MERALVVVDDTDAHEKLLAEAGELAAGVGADLVLLSLLTEEDLQEGLDVMDSLANQEPFTVDESQVTNAAADQADEIAANVFDEDVRYETRGEVADEDEFAETVLEVAEETGADHVFITGRRRSPTGKAIFGDTAQAVALNFDDPVTILTT